jgi:hypothetical protein
MKSIMGYSVVISVCGYCAGSGKNSGKIHGPQPCTRRSILSAVISKCAESSAPSILWAGSNSTRNTYSPHDLGCCHEKLPRRSKRNVRKSPRPSIPELAASISRVGLLQNLIVILAADGEAYGSGGR